MTGRAALALLLFAAPAAAQRVPPLTPSFMVGRWTDNGDCARYVIFRSDGTFLSHAGGEGTWRLARDRLTLTPRGGRATVLGATVLAQGRIAIVNPDGSRGVSERCPAR
ncbi:hypothetical protein [Sphingosinicella sp.]|uniref:hypothetical protein n=1 Tax=Sphingosinicella sp. TaxID=1917971 RepID=UPI00403764DC